jgi:hypothetical protein
MFHFTGPFPVLFCKLSDSFHFLLILFFLFLDLFVFVVDVFFEILQPLFMPVENLEPWFFMLNCDMMGLLPGRDETELLMGNDSTTERFLYRGLSGFIGATAQHDALVIVDTVVS